MALGVEGPFSPSSATLENTLLRDEGCGQISHLVPEDPALHLNIQLHGKRLWTSSLSRAQASHPRARDTDKPPSCAQA